jgi:hypothetical protein
MRGFGPWDEEIASALGSITSQRLYFFEPCVHVLFVAELNQHLFITKNSVFANLVVHVKLRSLKYIKYTWN